MPKEDVAGSLDLPLITEATNEFYRQVYSDPLLYPIFRGYNMVVLRRHVSYFIFQLTAFEEPMTPRQIDYLRRAHAKVVEQRGVTQRHYDMIASLLVSSLRACGADGQQLLQLASKLRPVRDIFPPCKAATQTTTPTTQAGQQPKHQREQPGSASNAAVQQQQQSLQSQQEQQEQRSDHVGGSTTAQQRQQTSQLAVQQDVQQCSQAPSAHQQDCCCCHSHSAGQPAGVVTPLPPPPPQQQQQHNAVQVPVPLAMCKDVMHSNSKQQEQQQQQLQQEEGQLEKPRGLQKTRLWWKRLMTTIKSH